MRVCALFMCGREGSLLCSITTRATRGRNLLCRHDALRRIDEEKDHDAANGFRSAVIDHFRYLSVCVRVCVFSSRWHRSVDRGTDGGWIGMKLQRKDRGEALGYYSHFSRCV